MKKIFIIDGYGLIYRTYFAFITRPLRDEKGNNVSAVVGFFNTLFMILRDYKPDYLVVAMDSHGPTFRHKLYPEYKANREAAPEDLHAEVPYIEEILKALDVPSLKKEGIEADDIIASLTAEASKEGIESIMVTGDKDLLQLVSNTKGIFALRPPKKDEKQYRLFGEEEVEEEFGIKSTQIVDYLAMMGDSSDNVPGVKGIGAKGAAKLLNQYGSIDGILEHLSDLSPALKQKFVDGKDDLELSRTLVRLKADEFVFESLDTASFKVDNLRWGAAAPYFDAIGSKHLAAACRKNAEASGDSSESPAVEAMPSLGAALERETSRKTSGDGPSPEDYRAPAEFALPGKLVTVKSLDEADKLLSGMETFAFDLETTSLDEMEARPVGFSFCSDPGIAYYVPIIADGGERRHSDEEVRALLKKHLEDPGRRVVGQNLKYDYKVLRRYGVNIANLYWDTMISAWLIASDDGRYGMDRLAEKYLNYKTVHFTDVVEEGKLFSDVDTDKATEYAAEDSLVTWRLYKFFEVKLERGKLREVFDRLEMPLVRILADMELEGVSLDVNATAKFSAELADEARRVESEIYAEVGHEFNIGSPKQLQTVLFEERGNRTGRKTKTGYSTDSDVLAELADSDPVAALVLRYRTVIKLKNTYTDALPKLINPETGRIHTSFIQTGTATGRLSSRNPNLQNIPIRTDEGRRIREAFTAKPGYLLLSADYSQIELVVMAHMSQDERLIEAFRSGKDVHSATAALVFGVPINEVTSTQRRMAKVINFGMIYGMSSFGLATDLKISNREAKEFMDNYFSLYSKVGEFVNRVKKEAAETGSVYTILGHERSLSGIAAGSKMGKAAIERAAVNSVIQGSAAEILKIAMISIARDLPSSGIDAKLLLSVHDELIFEVKESDSAKLGEFVKTRMEGAEKLSVPLKANVETGKNWGEMHL